MKISIIGQLINAVIAAVWLVNGAYCKVLNFVPRHQMIVENILNVDNGRWLTVCIGLLEIGMAVWILSPLLKRLNVGTQISLILTMNVIEFVKVPDLLMWGGLNLVFSFLFCVMIAWHYFTFTRIH